MIEVAKERSKQYHNIRFEVADATEWMHGGERFDCVVSIAMLHHVAAEEMLSTMGRLLAWRLAGHFGSVQTGRGQGCFQRYGGRASECDAEIDQDGPIEGTTGGARGLDRAWAPRHLPDLFGGETGRRKGAARSSGEAAFTVALFDHLEEAGLTCRQIARFGLKSDVEEDAAEATRAEEKGLRVGAYLFGAQYEWRTRCPP